MEERIGAVVGGSSFSSVHFVLEPGKLTFPGELIKVKVRDDIYTICRVVEVRAVSEYDKPALVHLRNILGLEAFTSSSNLAPKRFDEGFSVPIEELVYDGSKWHVREVRHLVPPGAPVFRLGLEDLKAVFGLPEPDRGLVIGYLYGTESVPVVLDPNNVLPRHVLIVGTTGTGKSYALGVISEELQKLGIRHIHVDVHGEFIKAAHELGGRVMTPGKDLTVKLNSLSELEILELIPGLTELQGELVRRAFLELKKMGRPFGIDELVNEIDEVAPLFRARQDTILNAKARAEMLRYVPIIGSGIDWLKELEAPGSFINIDCRHLRHSELQALVSALSRELLELLRDEKARKKLRGVVLSIDEAHLFLPPRWERELAPSAHVLSEVIRFGRHYGLCLILVTPSPLDIDRRIVRITNTRLIFALEPDQLEALKGVFADAPGEIIQRLPKLEQGICLLTGSRETVRHAILVRIRERRTTHGGETPKLI